jgi:hypothetical protein
MKMKKLAYAVIALTMFGLVAHGETMNSETETAAMSLGAHASSQFAFEKGKTALSSEMQTELRKIVDQAKNSGKIGEIKVIAWADSEYPAEGTKAPKMQIKLADDRGEKIKRFLKKELKVSDVAVYNMAKRPNSLQELFNTQTAKIKSKMETTGAAPTTKGDTGMFGYKGKASEALVLVYTN